MKLQKMCVILVLITSFLLASCGKPPSSDEIAYRLLKLYPSLPVTSQFIKDGEPYHAGYISPASFGYLYTGNESAIPEWDMIEEFRLVLSDSTELFELHVIRAKSASDVDEIAKLLRRRADMLIYHSTTEEDYPIPEPLIYCKGFYAILVVTHDNDAAKLLLKQLL